MRFEWALPERLILALLWIFPLAYFTGACLLGAPPYPYREHASNFLPNLDPYHAADLIPYLTLNGLLLVLWLWRSRLRASSNGAGRFFDFAWIASALWMSISTALHPDPRWAALLAWQSGPFLAIYARHNYGRVFGPRFVLAVAGVALVSQLLLCGLQYYSFSGDGTLEIWVRTTLAVRVESVHWRSGHLTRAVGAVGQTNALSGWIAMLLPLVFLGGRAAQRSGQRRLGLVCTSSALIGIVLLVRNLSRLSLIAGLAGLAAAIAFAADRSRRNGDTNGLLRSLAGSAVVAGLAGVSLLWSGGTLSGFLGIAQVKIADVRSSAGVRLGLAEAALHAVAERPLFGSGYGRGCKEMPELETVTVKEGAKYWGQRGLHSAAHNLFLMTAMDGGVPTVLFIVVTVGWTLARAYRWARHARDVEAAMALSVCVYLLLGLGYNVSYEPTAHQWPTFALLIGSLHAATASESS